METVGAIVRSAMLKAGVEPSPWKTLPARIGLDGRVSWDTLRKIVNEDYARARDRVYMAIALALRIDPVVLLKQVHLRRMGPEVRRELEASLSSTRDRSPPDGPRPSETGSGVADGTSRRSFREPPLIGITSRSTLTHAGAGFYLAPIHHAVVGACHMLGYRTEWVHHDAVEQIGRDSLAGLICVGYGKDEIRRITDAKFGVMPVVLVNRVPQASHIHAVTVDNREWAGRAVEHLVRLGHRNIGFIGMGGIQIYVEPRLQGYRETLERNGIRRDPDWEVCLSSEDPVQIHVEVAQILESRSVTALFIALGACVAPVLTALCRFGHAVPDDFSVVAFDDVPNPLYPLMPALTVVRQPLEALGRHSVELIHRLRRGPATGQVIDRIPAELVIRDSCRAMAEKMSACPTTAVEALS